MGAAARSLGSENSELQSMAARAKRLEQELSDLREAYARKIANTELRCEEQMREKDEEMRKWYREQRADIDKTKACVVIMHAIFSRLLKKCTDRKNSDKDEFDRHKTHLQSEQERLKQEHGNAMNEMRQKLKEQADTYDREMSHLQGQKFSLEETVAKLEERLSTEKALTSKLTETNNKLRLDCDTLSKKLAENEKVEELARKQAHIDSLEEEMRRTREMLEKKAKGEAEALRKELMDYVRFIVRILPDDLRHHVADGAVETLPQELKDKLNARVPGPHSPTRGGLAKPPWRDVGDSTEVLPPLTSPKYRRFPAPMRQPPLSARGGRF